MAARSGDDISRILAARTPFEVLGLPTQLTDEVSLRRRYKQLAIKIHPDKNLGDARADRAFQELVIALEELCDASKQAQYLRSPSRPAATASASGEPPSKKQKKWFEQGFERVEKNIQEWTEAAKADARVAEAIWQACKQRRMEQREKTRARVAEAKADLVEDIMEHVEDNATQWRAFEATRKGGEGDEQSPADVEERHEHEQSTASTTERHEAEQLPRRGERADLEAEMAELEEAKRKLQERLRELRGGSATVSETGEKSIPHSELETQSSQLPPPSSPPPKYELACEEQQKETAGAEFVCWLCQRRFKSEQQLWAHKFHSELHRANVLKEEASRRVAVTNSSRKLSVEAAAIGRQLKLQQREADRQAAEEAAELVRAQCFEHGPPKLRSECYLCCTRGRR